MSSKTISFQYNTGYYFFQRKRKDPIVINTTFFGFYKDKIFTEYLIFWKL